MKAWPALFLLLFHSCLPIRKITDLPDILNENSGMTVLNEGIWFINDSGNEAALYKTDFKGKLLRQIYIKNAQNTDWEELCKDNEGNFYIADFGNNSNSRKDLCIYKIHNPEQISGDTVIAEKLSFYYAEQQQFPASKSDAYYDAEAMIVFNDSLYIFTKNRTVPNDGLIHCYRLPLEFGSEDKLAASLCGIYKIKNGHFLNSITAAALSSDEKTLILLSMSQLLIFKNFQGSAFFNAAKIRRKKIPFSQKEAIDFIGKDSFLISDEKSPFGKARLYQARLRCADY